MKFLSVSYVVCLGLAAIVASLVTSVPPVVLYVASLAMIVSYESARALLRYRASAHQRLHRKATVWRCLAAGYQFHRRDALADSYFRQAAMLDAKAAKRAPKRDPQWKAELYLSAALCALCGKNYQQATAFATRGLALSQNETQTLTLREIIKQAAQEQPSWTMTEKSKRP